MRTQNPNYHGYRFPPEIITYAVWLSHRFCLSFRDVEELLANRGVAVSYEAVHALVRYKLGAKPKAPRRAHPKKSPKRSRSFSKPLLPNS